MGRERLGLTAALAGLLCLAGVSPGWTQTPPGARLDALEQSGPQSPPAGGARIQPIEIHPDRTVTFRVRAPQANSVEISGHIIGANAHWRSVHKSLPLTRDAAGVWSITLGPLAPEIYEYGLIVDGVVATGDPTFKTQQIEIPSATPAYYDAQPDVPHGDVRSVVFYSKAIDSMRYMRVYTPPDYDEGKTRYPVLYLLHGGACCEDQWVDTVRANSIMDNLIAAHKAKPMIIVMPLGGRYGASWGLAPMKLLMSEAGSEVTNAGTQSNYTPGNRFEHDLLEDIIPFIDKRFRTIPDADHRAISGLSQGGIQSVTIGLRHTDVFHWVAPMSAGAENEGDDQLVRVTQDVVDHPEPIQQNLKLLFFAVGDEDVLDEADRRLVDKLRAKGVRLTFEELPGMHEFSVWRRGLRDLAPLLFTTPSSSSVPQP